MLIVFPCPPNVKSQLDHLLTSYAYENYAEIISCAIDALAALHQELGDSGHLVIGQADTLARTRRARTASNVGKSVRREGGEISRKAPVPASPGARPRLLSVPQFFLLEGIEAGDSRLFAATEPAARSSAASFPLPKWIFGQYNRLLPIKAASRGLARLLCADPRGPTIDEGPQQVAAQATGLGDYLNDVDAALGHTRDQRLATAFPTSGAKVAKSQARFANQFVACERKDCLAGLLSDLKLINWSSSGKERFQLTEAGWQFAMLKNPVLDEDLKGPITKFSKQEVLFLLDHISHHVPYEDFAYFAILEAICGGFSTPNQIDAELRKYGDHEGGEISSSFLASQRSGVVSRMTDLELVARERVGTKVHYVAQPGGKSYLKEYLQRPEKKELENARSAT